MKMLIEMNNLKHGEEVPGKLGRWCETHRIIHGRFYLCDAYSLDVRQTIKKEERRWLSASASYALMFLFAILLTCIALRP